MREFIVENLTNTEALSVTVILMNNIIALIVSFFIMFITIFLDFSNKFCTNIDYFIDYIAEIAC